MNVKKLETLCNSGRYRVTTTLEGSTGLLICVSKIEVVVDPGIPPVEVIFEDCNLLDVRVVAISLEVVNSLAEIPLWS